MKKLLEKIKNISLSERISALIAILGIAASIYSAVKTEQNGFATAFVNSLIMQFILTVALLWCVFEKWNHSKAINELEIKQKTIESELQDKKEAIKAYQDAEKTEIAECLDRMGTIATQVKNISKLNNDFSTRIPELTERSYHMLEILQTGNITNQDLISSEMLKALDDYAVGLFDLFKRYTTNLLNHVITIEEVCLALRGHTHKVSSTVKLFQTPLDFINAQKEDIVVYSAFRDKRTYDEGKREVGIARYSIDKSVDFVQCLQKDQFIINYATKDSGNYWNEHEDFDQYYNCAIVVPIKTKQPDGKYIFFGYLCCDCLSRDASKAAVFDKQCAQYLYAAAQSYATFLETLDSNWRDRVQEIDGQPANFLNIIYSRTFNGRHQRVA